ncbi:MAG: hypothetical protein AABX70_08140 [Nanoarchaeota archaeon]
MKVLDRKKKKWTKYPGRLSEACWKKIDRFLLPVILPKYLISYKKLLRGKHHQIDVAALKKCLK